MAGITVKSSEAPDEIPTPSRTRVEADDEPGVAFEFDSSTAATFAKQS